MTDLQVTESTTEISGPLYLEPLSFLGGGTETEAALIRELLATIDKCKYTGITFEGYVSRLDYTSFLSCMKPWCPKCGKKGGRMHKKRMRHMLLKMNSDLKDIVLKQLVFTLPQDQIGLFMSLEAMNSLVKMAERLIIKEFPGIKAIAYMHFFGDADPGKLLPHVNIHLLDHVGCQLMVSPSQLALIKKRWRRALTGFGCRGMDAVDVHYSFTQAKNRIKHMLEYMSRPCPGPENYKAMTKNFKLYSFFMDTVNHFRHIRYFNGWTGKERCIDSNEEIMKECQNSAGEKLIYKPGKTISWPEFKLRYKPWDYDDLGNGLYRMHGP